MRVLALDPGYDRLGVAVLERVGTSESLLFSTCITTTRSAPMADRFLQIGAEYSRILETYTPDLVALETLFFNKNQKTAIGVAEVRGILIYLATAHGVKLCEFSPQEVKVAVTGYGKSDKSSVIMMVKRLIRGVPEGALDDEYDAIAIGMTALAHWRGS